MDHSSSPLNLSSLNINDVNEGAGQEVVLPRPASAHSSKSEDWDPGECMLPSNSAHTAYGPPLHLQHDKTGKTSSLEGLLSEDRTVMGSWGLLGPACFPGKVSTRPMRSRRPGGPTIQQKVFRSAWDTTPINGKMLDDDAKVVGDHVTEQARVTVRMNGLSPMVPDGRAYITTLGLDSHLASLPVSDSSALTNMLSRPSIYESYDPLLWRCPETEHKLWLNKSGGESGASCISLGSAGASAVSGVRAVRGVAEEVEEIE
ncbi:hypothetical protein L198_01879 [Cryptococcus wingfieldii CBS 7118]|uniref:Uncharacterized protein n=1 Tax=Cryptococcus wingfieldii CBS 7118 TaxID=1295528 RepID=A0A1E3JWL4_9TREE|nr:hypothetical protein L198_01879 [Cryptococcus wingfieldii CBS 7118]ODO05190.1 hypothetical protein L198_01879 [Cryptococcus wingfieldii CBS 7118]